jgi:hypothetical protein
VKRGRQNISVNVVTDIANIVLLHSSNLTIYFSYIMPCFISNIVYSKTIKSNIISIIVYSRNIKPDFIREGL